MRIDDRVREAHLSHYCPGGMGLPTSASDANGLPSGEADTDDLAEEDNQLQAAGETCERCGMLVRPGQDVRRRLTGALVHGTCPPALPDYRFEAAAYEASSTG
jgi:hypothetical protein